MTLLTLLFAATLATCLGIVAAVLMRVGGLAIIVFGLVALVALRWISGHAYPTFVESLLLIVLLQVGYLIGALTPLADRIRRGHPASRLSIKPGKDTE